MPGAGLQEKGLDYEAITLFRRGYLRDPEGERDGHAFAERRTDDPNDTVFPIQQTEEWAMLRARYMTL
jgi:hypothetical protein